MRRLRNASILPSPFSPRMRRHSPIGPRSLSSATRRTSGWSTRAGQDRLRYRSGDPEGSKQAVLGIAPEELKGNAQDRSRPRPDGRRAGVREQGKIVCGTGVAIRKVPSRPCSASLRKRLRETLTSSWLWPEFERGLIWTAFPSLRTEQGDQGLTIPTFTKPI